MRCLTSGNLTKVAIAAALLCSTARGHAQPPASGNAAVPQVRVEYFGPERGFTIGRSDIILLCVVRNIGVTPLPDKALSLHCYTVAGLDYTQGDMNPGIPALAPNQAAAFRWRLAPSESRQSIIAGVQVEGAAAGTGRPAAAPPVALAVVPRFDVQPRFGAPIAGADLMPQAGAARGDAWLASNRVALRFLDSDRAEPLLLLAAKQGPNWQMVATGLPLASVKSGEDGQIPWWQTLRWRRVRTYSGRDRATLTLVGNIGAQWNAVLTFEVRHDTCVVEGRLRLTARRTLRCYSVHVPRLLAAEDVPNGGTTPRADGSPLLVSESDPSPLPEDVRVLAVRQLGTTYGISWPANPAIPGWAWSGLSGPASAGTALEAACSSADRAAGGEVVLSGATLEFSFRLFAFGPSDTVRDALRFVMP